ncbi:intimin-like inverse autotransporter protein SinH, partial [Salmonella enterica]|nr:intimin-like inverse autotransporter protein SinH [Salmonella enterica]
EDKHPTVNNAYRFLLWRDKNKDGVFQMSEQLTEEEMALYDYQWEFTGQSTNGHTGALANTINEDLVLPVTNKEAAQKFAANVEDGVQGYGIRVTYSQK